MDTAALRSSWDQVTSSGDEVPLFFYSHLFLSHPELRSMFPISMAAQRDRLVGALGRIVSNVDDLAQVTPFIEQLGRDHRRFSVVANHYNAVGASLLATLKHFLGPAWTDQLAGDWAAAYGIIARVKDGHSWSDAIAAMPHLNPDYVKRTTGSADPGATAALSLVPLQDYLADGVSESIW